MPVDRGLTITQADSPISSTTADLGPVSAGERVTEIDVLRGLALLGIVIVNMSMDLPWIRLIPLRTSEAWINEPLYRAIDILAEGKFYLLFSFLFGVGFFIQMSRAEARGAAFARIYIRRLLALYAIGIALGLLAGESQLRIYASLGFLLLLLRPVPQRALLTLAIILALFEPARDLAEAWQRRGSAARIEAASQERAAVLARRTQFQRERVELHQRGSFTAITRAHLPRTFWDWSWLTGEFPFLLLGFWAGRRGLLNRIGSRRRELQRTFIWCLAFGLMACIAAQVIFERRQLWQRDPATWGNLQIAELLDRLGSPVLTLAYASGLLLLMAQPFGRSITKWLASVGQMALTNYILQWLVFALLTYSYGLALYGQFGLAFGVVFAISLFALQVAVSLWYMERFRFGPAEWMWRTVTYLRRPPLRR